MAVLPQIDTTISRIDAAVEERFNGPPRMHLGASVIGNECERALWYGFRWCAIIRHGGRLLRLFSRGQDEEERFARLLRMVCSEVFTINPNTGRQFQFSDLGGHFGGSMDAAVKGLIEAPKTWHVCEMKTHGDKSFRELEKKGVKESKPEHYAQMQMYMHWSKMDRAYYLAVNKNDDSLYGERVNADKAVAKQLLEKAERIITAPTPPPGISTDPSWFKCKWCNFSSLCHGKQIPCVNCRTCAHATPELDGEARWSCAAHKADVPPKAQLEGCKRHLFIPQLLPWEAVDAGDDFVEYQTEQGTIRNVTGENSPAARCYTSSEIKAGIDGALTEPIIEAAREMFQGRIA